MLYFLEDGIKENENFIDDNLNDICASYQHSIVDYLIYKLEKAIKKHGIKELAIAGGVSANSALRQALKDLAEKHQCKLYIPDFQYCTDNGAMIAMAGYFKYLDKDFCGQDATPVSRMPLNSH